MNTTEILKTLLSFSIYKVPVLLVILAGIAYCAVNFSKYRAVNIKALIGLAILLAVEVLGLFVPLVNIYLFREFGSTSGSLFYAASIFSFLLSLGFAAGLGLILFAVWTNRRPE